MKSKLSTKSNSLKLLIGKTIHVISFSGFIPIQYIEYEGEVKNDRR